MRLTKKATIAVSIALAAALLAVAIGAFSAKAPVGLVTYITGKAQVKHAKQKKWLPAEQGMQLFEGDTFRTVGGGKATIMHPDGSLTRLAQNSTLALNAKFAKKKAKPKKSGPVLVASLWGSVNSAAGGKGSQVPSAVAGIRESEPIKKSMEMMELEIPEPGTSGGSGQTRAPAPALDFIILVSPKYTGLTASDTVEFAWDTRVPGPYVYKLTLSDEAAEVWSTITKATSTVYPGDAPPLAANMAYRWKVDAFYQEAEPAFTAEAGFTIIADTSKIAKLKKELAASKADPVTSRLLLAALYDEMFLKQAALAEYLALVRENPGVPIFKNLADSLATQLEFDNRSTALFEKHMMNRR